MHTSKLWPHDLGQHFIKHTADQIPAVCLCTRANVEKHCAAWSALTAALQPDINLLWGEL